jgi:hypothetical protein
MGLVIPYVSLNITEKIIIPKPNIFTVIRTQDNFWVCDLSSCNLPAETNNFVLCTVLLSSLVSELLKLSSPGIEPKTVYRDCGLCYCNLLFETNNFGLGAVLLSCLVFELQEPPSPGTELRTHFTEF